MSASYSRMRRVPPKSTVDDLPRDIAPPNGSKSPAPPVVVQAWCLGVERMNRQELDRFTIRTGRILDERDLGDLRAASLRRRRVLARQAWP